ncbi:MAG TPA: hypothetical protein VG187_13250 [Mycobacterium sp.]|nr:hypothetical protein [Mycobacterium sp.]
MNVTSDIRCLPDMVRAWSGKTPNKAALIDGGADMPVDVSDLVSHCRGLIAGYKVPKEIHLTDALPQTASGRVQKAALRQQLRGE